MSWSDTPWLIQPLLGISFILAKFERNLIMLSAIGLATYPNDNNSYGFN
jgi:hypothetical protein